MAKSAASLDTGLGRAVIEMNLATHGDVAECVEEQKRLAAENSQRSLADVMLEKGVLTRRQLARVKTGLEELRTPEQIPGFKILSKLGAGAMATVFKARQVSLDREVAIKVLPKRFSENPDYVERFYREGQAAAKLNHANIVQAIDVGEANGYHYFVMEYVEGDTLYDSLEGGTRLGEGEALRIILQIARALAHAHERGLIHRDVKPKNIMLTPDGVAKLADMGLARMAADEQAAQAEAGKAYGTPYYISPEQIRGEIDIDFRADIYGLGATLYHAVTGRVPFEGPTPAAVMHKHLKEPLIPPDHINTDLSVGIGEVVEVMMAKERDDRYSSTTEVLMDLEAVAAGQPPLLARQRIDADVLSGLASQASGDLALTGQGQETQSTSVSVTYLILLGGLLAFSIVLNVILLALFSRS